jgi:hypothetical protein
LIDKGCGQEQELIRGPNEQDDYDVWKQTLHFNVIIAKKIYCKKSMGNTCATMPRTPEGIYTER